MQHMQFHYEYTQKVNKEHLEQVNQHLQAEIGELKKSLELGYETDYAFLNCPADGKVLERVAQVIGQKREHAPTALVVIGIGGSNLGAMAVHQALNGRFYNQSISSPNVYFADTTDPDYINDIRVLVERELKGGNNIILNVISKSGSTTETIANFHVFLELLKKYKPDNYANYVVATTGEGSKLWSLAEKEGFSTLPIPKKLGGRFSVLSPVGLFPLGMLGVNLVQLLSGAQSIIPLCINEDLLSNPAALSAAVLFLHYQQGYNIHDTFLFSVDLENVGKWYRQLMGESVGKEKNKKGEEVNVGMTPTVSIGSADLHSVAQLYLGGPLDKVTTFITVGKSKNDVAVPEIAELQHLVEHIQGKPLTAIMNAIVQGTQAAYKKRDMPFISIGLPEKNAFYIGQLLQLKMIEIVYLAYLLDVNPFDQPNVELYKKETREILANE